MPMFDEEFLSQLSQEQLAQVIQHQQALIQQHPQAPPTKKSNSAAQLPPKAQGARRSRSAKRSQQHQANLIAASNAAHGLTENSSR